jgi:trans-aconitate methyltransferase
MSDRTATDDAYFAECWAASEDPWAHTTRWSETRKYALTVAVLPRRTYARSFEPGCGVGLLTRLLAARTAEHVAMERHPRGVAVATDRCRDLPHVEIREGRIPDAWPEGTFDLVVLSEVLYYLSSDELDETLARLATALAAGGDVVAVHYRQEVPEHTWSGDEVHDRLRSHPGLTPVSRTIEDDVAIDVLRR